MNAVNRYRGFISYRRDDTRYFVGRIYEVFRRDLPDDLMFHDVGSIDAGVSFRNAIDRAISGAAVVLVVIGPGWLNMTGPGGRRRLDDPDDPVRLEIETALRHGVELLPVLVDDARMPGEHELPASLAELAIRNAVRIRSDTFDRDVAEVIQDVDGLVAAAFPERRPASGETFHVTDRGDYLGMAAAGGVIAIILWVYGVIAENVWLRLAGSILLGAAVIPAFLAYYGRDDRLAVNPGGIEVRKTGLTHRFSWREIDRIDTSAHKTSIFLVARTVSDRLKGEYAGRQTWPCWDAHAGHLVICDLKAEVRRGSGENSVTVIEDRYAGGSEYRVLREVTRYRPRGGYDGMPNPGGSPPAPRIRVALPLSVAVLVAASGISFAVVMNDKGVLDYLATDASCPVAPAAAAALTVTPDRGNARTLMTVTGVGFVRDGSVELIFHADTMGKAATDCAGRFSATLPIPNADVYSRFPNRPFSISTTEWDSTDSYAGNGPSSSFTLTGR